MASNTPQPTPANKPGIPYWMFMAALVAAGVAGYMWYMGMLNTGGNIDQPPPAPIGLDTPPPGASAGLHPDPRFSPSDVVMIQLRSLQHKDEPVTDAGIYTTYLFASMRNHESTGSYNQFAMFKEQARYMPLLNAQSVELLHMEDSGNQVQQYSRVVGPTGNTAYFIFDVSLESMGDFKGSWVTDGCIPVESNSMFWPTDPQPPEVDLNRPWQPSMN